MNGFPIQHAETATRTAGFPLPNPSGQHIQEIASIFSVVWHFYARKAPERLEIE